MSRFGTRRGHWELEQLICNPLVTSQNETLRFSKEYTEHTSRKVVFICKVADR